MEEFLLLNRIKIIVPVMLLDSKNCGYQGPRTYKNMGTFLQKWVPVNNLNSYFNDINETDVYLEKRNKIQ